MDTVFLFSIPSYCDYYNNENKSTECQNCEFNYLAKYVEVELLLYTDALLLVYLKIFMLSSMVVCNSSPHSMPLHSFDLFSPQ